MGVHSRVVLRRRLLVQLLLLLLLLMLMLLLLLLLLMLLGLLHDRVRRMAARPVIRQIIGVKDRLGLCRLVEVGRGQGSG